MLLIHSKDLKEISGINRDTVKPNKKNANNKAEKNTTTGTEAENIKDIKFDPSYYKQLAQTFTLRFYRDQALPKLLTRLKAIVKDSNYNKADIAGSDKAINNPDTFIDVLLKKNQQGNFLNLGNKLLVADFYEFIFIMLKIKYIDHQIRHLSIIKTEDVIKQEQIAMALASTSTAGGSISSRFLISSPVLSQYKKLSLKSITNSHINHTNYEHLNALVNIPKKSKKSKKPQLTKKLKGKKNLKHSKHALNL